MTMPTKLTENHKHLLRLVSKGQDCPDGWAPVSKPVYPLVKTLPQELVELHQVGDEGRGRARLTTAGQNLIDAMEWL